MAYKVTSVPARTFRNSIYDRFRVAPPTQSPDTGLTYAFKPPTTPAQISDGKNQATSKTPPAAKSIATAHDLLLEVEITKEEETGRIRLAADAYRLIKSL